MSVCSEGKALLNMCVVDFCSVYSGHENAETNLATTCQTQGVVLY